MGFVHVITLKSPKVKCDDCVRSTRSCIHGGTSLAPFCLDCFSDINDIFNARKNKFLLSYHFIFIVIDDNVFTSEETSRLEKLDLGGFNR